MSICSIIECSNAYRARGMCVYHYNKAKLNNEISNKIFLKICKFDDCNKKCIAKGYCNKHYKQFKKYGAPQKNNRDKTEIDRFNSKIKINKITNCHEWTDHLCSWGYGVFRLKKSHQIKAHRYAYQNKFGTIPKNLFVCHHCDNPSCVNPDHLFLGTALDNNLDKIRKKRHNNPKGENHFRTKLKINEVIEIKKLIEEIKSPKKISLKLNIPVSLIESIKYKKTWVHL